MLAFAKELGESVGLPGAGYGPRKEGQRLSFKGLGAKVATAMRPDGLEPPVGGLFFGPAAHAGFTSRPAMGRDPDSPRHCRRALGPDALEGDQRGPVSNPHECEPSPPRRRPTAAGRTICGPIGTYSRPAPTAHGCRALCDRGQSGCVRTGRAHILPTMYEELQITRTISSYERVCS